MNWQLESMESRLMFAIQAVINPQNGLLSINGDGADNVIVVSRDAAGTIFINGGAVPVLFGPPTVANTTRVDIRGFTGNDNFSADESNGALPRVDMSGGEGNDTLLGGSKVEVINGDDGDDFIDGRGGDDALNGEAGNDTFVWTPGSGSDFIQAGLDSDTLRFDGSGAGETFELFNDDGFFSVAHNLDAAGLLIQDLETVNLRTFGGQDVVNVRDLTAVDVTAVNINLAGASGTPDGQIDDILVDGTLGNDVLRINRVGTTDIVTGTAATVTILAADEDVDELTIDAFGGNDDIRVQGATSPHLALMLDGAAGNDTITGSAAADVLIGGIGDDFIEGASGDDTIHLGEGADTALWAVDENDTIEGAGGSDLLRIFGRDLDNLSDSISLAAFGTRLRVTHAQNIDNIDAGGIDTVEIVPFRGADLVNVNDLTGTTVTRVNIDLRGATAADGQADVLVVNATSSGDSIDITDSSAGTSITGLQARVDIFSADSTLDSLTLNALGGIDFVHVNQQAFAGAVRNVQVNLGDGHDGLDVNNTAPNGVVTIAPSDGDDSLTVNFDLTGFAAARFDATQRIGSLIVQANGIATLTPGGNKVLTTGSLATFNSGKFDLTDNDVIIDYFVPSPLTTVLSRVQSGFANGAWNGPGIISSTAAADHRTGIGIAEASDLFTSFPGTFRGRSVDATAIILSHTFSGDANLDGRVDVADLGALASHWQGAARWTGGDFDYTGFVDVSDLGMLATNWQAGVAAALPTNATRASGFERTSERASVSAIVDGMAR